MVDYKLSDGQDLDSFLRGGLDLEAFVERSGLAIREQAKVAYKQEWLDARLNLLAILFKLLSSKSHVPGNTSEEISHRILLAVAFVQGTTVTERLISEGQYIKATAALKQDYEILTRIREVTAGAAKIGQTPQVKHAPEGSQRFYGDLNKVAHPSNPDLIAQLLDVRTSGGATGPTFVPAFVTGISDDLYELHVWLLLEVTREVLVLFFELYGSADGAINAAALHFASILDLLSEAGFTISD
jgi:hypothetical protein